MRHALSVILILSACLASADVTNGSFETGTSLPASGSYESILPGSDRLTGWTIENGEIAWAWNTAFGVSPYDGQGHIDLYGFHDSNPSGKISQSIATVSGQTYEVSFAVGSFNGNIPQVRVQAGSAFADFTNPDGNFTWLPVTWSFVATSDLTLLSFEAGPSSSTVHAGLDGVSVQAVPEPASFAVLAAGGLVLLRRRRKA